MSDKKKSKPRTKKTTKKIFVDVKGVSKSYQMGEVEVQALNNVSLVLGLGEIVSIVGPSGSGKTTLLNVIGALDYVDSGSISINRKKLSSMSDKELSFLRRGTIGYIFQNFNLLEEINAEKNIEMPIILAKLEKEDRKNRVEELLECVDIFERRSHNPGQLSGGEQQ